MGRESCGGEGVSLSKACSEKTMISNSYGSTNCIRFEGIISAAIGTPWSIYSGRKDTPFFLI